MIYPLKSKPRRRPIFFSAVFVVLLGVVCGLLLAFAPGVAHRTGVVVATPFWALRASLATHFSYVGTFFISHKTLTEENARLRTELERTAADVLAYDTLSHEHEKLLQAYGRTDHEGRVLGVVLVKPPQSPYDTVVLDIGSGQGVAVGALAYGVGNAVLGRVTAVGPHSSTVTLFSNGETETQATVERSDVALTLHGTGGGGFEAKMPQDVDVVVGDSIVLPSIHVAIVGRVIALESTAASSFKRVVVQSPVNIHNLRWLEIVAPTP